MTLCLNMIVKNESKVIERALRSVKPVIDRWVIVDTGSTDETMALIEETLRGVPGELHQREWIDFETNRNQALSLARFKADYLLFMDADEEWTQQGQLIRLEKDYYTIRHRLAPYDFLRIACIRSDPLWRWEGQVHETIVHPQRHSLCFEELPGVLIHAYPSSSSRSEKNKCLEDALLLEKVHPKNERTIFYLGQCFFEACEYARALPYYKMRIAMGGWEEEIYYALFRIGVISEYHLHKESSVCIDCYEAAIRFRPSRIEARYFLACHHFKQQHYGLNYEILHAARRISPSNDAICVERWMSEWGIDYQLIGTCFLLQKYEEAHELAQKLLAQPALPPERRRKLLLDLPTLRNYCNYLN